MDKSMTGVVDIGSNAIRMLIGCLEDNGKIRKIMKHRVPIRLGADVFSHNIISDSNILRTIDAFKVFKKDFERFKVGKIKVVATSAVRESDNREVFIQTLFDETGLKIELIDYNLEAEYITQAAVNNLGIYDRHFLLMDIGGGSVEFVVGTNGKVADVISLPLGTVRLLQGCSHRKKRRLQIEQQIFQFQKEIENIIQQMHSPAQCFIGTGGNMDCLGYLRRLLFRKESRYRVRFHELDYIVEELFRLSTEERMKKFELREDRADVILPASVLSQFVLSHLDLDRIVLPGVGLKEGLLLSVNHPD